MTRTLVRGMLLAVAAGAVAAFGGLGLDATWPILLAAAVGFVPGIPALGRLGGFALGTGAGWLAFGLRAEFLPFVQSSRGIALAIGVLIVTAGAVATRDHLPLWAGVAGLAAFWGTYEPRFTADPGSFLDGSVVALTTVLLSLAVGYAIAAIVASVPGATQPAAPSMPATEV